MEKFVSENKGRDFLGERSHGDRKIQDDTTSTSRRKKEFTQFNATFKQNENRESPLACV